MADKVLADPYLKLDPYRQEPQHIGQAAGGRGTMGLLNDGANHRQAPDLKGAFGPSVENGLVSGEAQRLIAKSTGVNIGAHENPTNFYGAGGNKY